MTIPVPLFSQRDEKWKAKKLGTSSVTLGGYGCLVACLAMVAKYYGKDTDPDKMNESLKSVGGFAQQNLYTWGSLNKIYGDISETANINTPKPVIQSQFDSIESELKAGRPVICEVDMIPATSNVDMHFVVLIGKNGQWMVADPWYGDTASLNRYGEPAKTIQKYVFTSGPIPPSQSQDLLIEITGLKNQVSVYKQQLQDLAQKLGTGMDFADIIGGVRKLIEIEDQLNEVKTMNEELKSNVLGLNEKVSLLTKEKNGLLLSTQELTASLKSTQEALDRTSQDIEVLRSKRDIEKYTTWELTKVVISRILLRK